MIKKGKKAYQAYRKSRRLAKYGKSKNWVKTKSNVSYRGDTRAPDEILESGGFKSRGDNQNLYHHISGDRMNESAFIPTTTSLNVAKRFARKKDRNTKERGWLYVLINVEGVDAAATFKSLGNKLPFKENEISVLNHIPTDKILGAYKMGNNRKFTGKFIKINDLKKMIKPPKK